MPTDCTKRSAQHSRTGSSEVGRLVQDYDEHTDQRRPHELGFGYYYQGDIMLPDEEQDVARVSLSDRYYTSVWPNAIVPYYIEPGTFKPNEILIIERSMAELQRQTCVRFIPRTPQTTHFVRITSRSSGCFASVGRQEDNSRNILNLQTPACLYRGTPVHELMHILGFLHEVSRVDRDEYIYIDRNALKPEYQTDSFFNTNFGKAADGMTTTYNISYNYGSIMHYSKTAGSKDGRQQVLYNLKEYNKPDFGSDHAIPSDIQAINMAKRDQPNEILIIERSMTELQRQTCVRFIPRTPQTTHFVRITNRHAGCFASLGRQEDNSQNILNLQTPVCLFGGTPVHELMHTLGFLHEVSRADRDEYIYIDRNALSPEYKTDSFFATNFGKDVDGITTTYNISYNYGSIMHYSKTAGSRDGRQQVLYNLKEYDKPDFGSNHAMPSDIQAIKYRYCNATIDRSSVFSTLPFYPKPN
ncbi:zinc metalloproteinase nas-8-like [Anopheles darlingi]|uniref:zinc metalloproteinase nas-8-like n=1 Tax=Anopheles darlingi TaxID=43151 RepID=UPI0021000EF0|nr:zinc metalloproteinase nas-8-like [Anopheles darlingi]